jgi:hypothetical protein
MRGGGGGDGELAAGGSAACCTKALASIQSVPLSLPR